MNGGILIEVCADSIESAIAAQNGGAGRIELCYALEIGGLTPSKGLIDYVISHVRIPVNILIRPRSGDFIYSADEIDLMKSDIYYAKSAGASGIVTGILSKNATVNMQAMKILVEASNPLPVTFHRAFDLLVDKHKALEDIISLGCARLLTSGGFKSATTGSHIISELIKQAGDRILIMPGAGINAKNFAELVEATGCREFHLSASAISVNPMEHVNIHLSEVFPPDRHVSDVNEIKNICSLADILSD
ncbi:MAG TPA: copper homeostasis protein CutC [Lentimicrobium sp.]|nr:copper homeostasis protein CutC [Lentimicrobium sp.]